MKKTGIIEIEAALSISEPLASVDAWLVIDLLRASTVMVQWFERGGKEIYPVYSPEDALDLKAKMTSAKKNPFLMGERNAVPPEGFDMGNSPLEITEALTKKHPVAIMATTNGTKALLKAVATGAAVYAACARNAFYALDLAMTHGSRIGILCAGRLGRPAVDDTLCAGMMIDRLCRVAQNVVMLDGANIAHTVWKNWMGNFEQGVRSSDHARFLEKIGFGEDIKFSCQQDVTAFVPELREIEDEYGDGLRAVLVHERERGLRYFSPDVVSSIMHAEFQKKEEEIHPLIEEEPEKNDGDESDVTDGLYFGAVSAGSAPRKTLEIDFGE